jgi:hypothetical protein
MKKRIGWAIFNNEMLCGGNFLLNKVLQKCMTPYGFSHGTVLKVQREIKEP